jgi:alpha-glucosidase
MDMRSGPETIDTGFPSMAYQRRRMIAAMDLGASHWSMDTGGFKGHPTAENYARWLEFAAWVPIDRLHGDFGEKRQPGVYGSVAEAAATKTIRTRYAVLPYFYSFERVDHLTGIGIVRPIFWIFPDDRDAASLDTEWMFGDALLVSPVVNPGATSQRVYLPAGGWYDFNTGRRFEGKSWGRDSC